jgi:hypothetical protein
LCRLKAAISAPNVELIEPLVLFLLVANVSSHGFLVAAHYVYEKPASPEMLADEIALRLPVDPRQSIKCPSR